MSLASYLAAPPRVRYDILSLVAAGCKALGYWVSSSEGLPKVRLSLGLELCPYLRGCRRQTCRRLLRGGGEGLLGRRVALYSRPVSSLGLLAETLLLRPEGVSIGLLFHHSDSRPAMNRFCFACVALLATQIALPLRGEQSSQSPAMPARTIGRIEKLDDALDALVDAKSPIEVLGEGFEWSEGPVWIRDGGFLLFSDVPKNTVYQYRDGQGVRAYLMPSGHTSATPRTGELGSNGLTLDRGGRLLLCQHGDRRVARLDSPLPVDGQPAAKFTTVADRYEGKRFNSPNDLVVHSSGAVYFTDPPYGIEKGGDLATKELNFHGVFRAASDGGVTLLTKELTRPNGLAFSPDEQTLYVGNSDPERPIWMALPVRADGSVGEGKVFFDGGELHRSGLDGMPDGLRVDAEGNLWATGPGGVLVITPQGKHLGTIVTGTAIANCAFGDDGRTLYLTSHQYLCRVKLKAKGAGF